MAGKFYAGPVEILSGVVKCPITSIQIMGFESRLWDLGVVGQVDKEVSFHAWYVYGIPYCTHTVYIHAHARRQPLPPSVWTPQRRLGLRHVAIWTVLPDVL